MNIGDLVDAGFADIKTGPFGTQLRASDYVSVGRPVLNVRNVGFGDVRPKDLEYVDEETATPSPAHLLTVNDIVFGRKGAVERHAFIRDRFEGAMQGSDCIRLRVSDSSPMPARFITFVLRTKQHQSWMKSFCSHGATMASLNQDIVRQIPLPEIDADHRELAVAVLQNIDDLIENTRRRVDVLEEMARAIYREWFVKFRYPGHEVIPFVDSILGPIPEGWGVHPFSEVVEHHIGGGWGTEQEEPGSEEPGYVIRGTDIPRVAQSDVSTVPFRFHRESNLRSRKLKSGDIVFEVSGGSKGQPVGRSLLVRQSLLDEFDAPTMCASFCKLVRVNPTVAEPSILIRLLQDAYTSGQLNSYQVQSTGITNFRWKPFLEYFNVALPPVQLQKELGQTFDRLDELVANSGRRIGVLAQIQDMLLPKLVSGQIDVSLIDLDALVGDQVA